MPEHSEIYQDYSPTYHQLVMAEDHQHNLLPAIRAVCQLEGRDVVEMGAGTGRVSALVLPHVGKLWACDASLAMLSEAGKYLTRQAEKNWCLLCADHRNLPLTDACANLVIAGWSLCYLVTWNPGGWRVHLEAALAEIRRVLRPGGQLVLIETLGTGEATPFRAGKLLPYYEYLEEAGFKSTWLRTDYRFASLAEARQLTAFFFGEAMLARLNEDDLTLPECTGIWQRRYV